MSFARIGLWVVTLGALALCARAWWVDVVPGSLLLGALLAVGSVAVLGVVNPEWEMFGSVIHGVPEAAGNVVLCLYVAADGPWRAVLDALAARDAHATFVFYEVSAENVQRVRDVVAHGHDVALGARGSVVRRALLSVRGAVRLFESERAALAQAASMRVIGVVIPRHFAPSGLLLAAARLGLFAVVAEPLRFGALKPGRAGLIYALQLPAEANGTDAVQALLAWLDATQAARSKVVALSSALAASSAD
jgi:hypothetical protein